MPESSLAGAQFAHFLRAVSPAWELNSEEEIGVLGMSGDDLLQMSEGTSTDGLASGADLVGALNEIHGSLCLIYPLDKDARGWLRRPNAARIFGGLTPLQALMRHDADLTLRVANYAQSAVSGDFS